MGIPLQSREVFGLGIYSFADAARFIGAGSGELRRWMTGYTRTRNGETHEYTPLWQPQLAGTEIEGVGFRDLIELRFIRIFVSAGVPLLLIRRAIEELQERLGKEYPFTSTQFKTDGRRIFMEMLDENGDQSLVDVVRRQNVMLKVIGPSLRDGVVLNVDEEATRWYPVSRSKAVVLDPERSFGQPILTASGVPTVAVANAVKAEGGDVGRVARLFEISISDARRAVAFEEKIAP